MFAAVGAFAGEEEEAAGEEMEDEEGGEVAT